MSSFLYKIDKNLNLLSEVDLSLEFSNGMTISHFEDINVSDKRDLTFSFEALPNNVPILNDEEYVVVIREKVNLSDNTPTEIITKNNGTIEGSKNNNKKRPYSHPNGVAIFRELRGVK